MEDLYEGRKLSTVEVCDMIYGSNLYEGRKAKRVESQDTSTGTDGVADEPTSAQRHNRQHHFSTVTPFPPWSRGAEGELQGGAESRMMRDEGGRSSGKLGPDCM
jgi:hypothetical protein